MMKNYTFYSLLILMVCSIFGMTSCSIITKDISQHDHYIPEQCLGEIFELTYGQAKEFISNYEKATEGKIIYTDSIIIKGNHFPICMEFAVQRCRNWSTYHEMGGLRVYYGLSQGETIDNKFVLLIPLSKKGIALALSEERAIVGLKLPTGFRDPCPPDCEFVQPYSYKQ